VGAKASLHALEKRNLLPPVGNRSLGRLARNLVAIPSRVSTVLSRDMKMHYRSDVILIGTEF
jgi:hypothetical protein